MKERSCAIGPSLDDKRWAKVAADMRRKDAMMAEADDKVAELIGAQKFTAEVDDRMSDALSFIAESDTLRGRFNAALFAAIDVKYASELKAIIRYALAKGFEREIERLRAA